MMRSRYFSAALIGLVLAGSAAAAQEVYTGPSVFVPYAGPQYNPGGNALPTMLVSFCGRSIPVQLVMDTGSTGIVVSPDVFQPCTENQTGTPGETIYSSSGGVHAGTWYDATVSLFDPKSNSAVAVAKVPVLQTTKTTCQPNARNCVATDSPKGVSMMGVGFGRQSADQQPQSWPTTNPFINVVQAVPTGGGAVQPVPSSWAQGYVITRSGAYLGLSAENTKNAAWVQLKQTNPPQPASNLPEWSGTPAEISVNGTVGAGSVLMDTGVSTGYLSAPGNATVTTVPCGTSNCAAPGTKVALYFPNKTAPKAQIAYTVGEGGAPVQPPGGVVVVNDGAPFDNTTHAFYNAYSVALDAVKGWVGFIKTK